MNTNHIPSLDNLFRLLAHNRRRYVLYYFNEYDTEVVDVDELATQLRDWERNWEDKTSKSERNHHEEICTELYHSHLPQLAEANLIEYDPRSEMVRQWDERTIDQYTEMHQEELDRLFGVFKLAPT